MRAVAIGRIGLFCARHGQAWAGADASWDYYSLTCSINFATVMIGFEYVWRKTRHELKKSSIGWECSRTLGRKRHDA